MNENKSELLKIKYKGFWLIYAYVAFASTIIFSIWGYLIGGWTLFCFTIGIASLYIMLGSAFCESESNTLRILELEKIIKQKVNKK